MLWRMQGFVCKRLWGKTVVTLNMFFIRNNFQPWGLILYQMSNVFVIIKMCYVHNQWYDISCATLYVHVCACGVVSINMHAWLTPVLLKQHFSRVLQVCFGTAHYRHQFRVWICIITRHSTSDGDHTVFCNKRVKSKSFKYSNAELKKKWLWPFYSLHLIVQDLTSCHYILLHCLLS